MYFQVALIYNEMHLQYRSIPIIKLHAIRKIKLYNLYNLGFLLIHFILISGDAYVRIYISGRNVYDYEIPIQILNCDCGKSNASKSF